MKRLLRRARHRLSSSPIRRLWIDRRHHGLRAADMFVASYPRSGNTWLRSLLYDLLVGRSPTFGAIDAPDSPVGHVGDQETVPETLPGGGRWLKTHESWRSEYLRAVVLVRDVRDVAWSEYRYQHWQGLFAGSFEDFADRFLRGSVNGYGGWSEHVLSWSRAAERPETSILLLRYEDLRARPLEGFRSIVSFAGLDAEDSELERILEANSIARMRAREDREKEGKFGSANREFRFVNRGISGSWKDRVSAATMTRILEGHREPMELFGYLPDEAAERS